LPLPDSPRMRMPVSPRSTALACSIVGAVIRSEDGP
jgi:hypothetical protein